MLLESHTCKKKEHDHFLECGDGYKPRPSHALTVSESSDSYQKRDDWVLALLGPSGSTTVENIVEPRLKNLLYYLQPTVEASAEPVVEHTVYGKTCCGKHHLENTAEPTVEPVV